jgi:hypothetical protein
MDTAPAHTQVLRHLRNSTRVSAPVLCRSLLTSQPSSSCQHSPLAARPASQAESVAGRQHDGVRSVSTAVPTRPCCPPVPPQRAPQHRAVSTSSTAPFASPPPPWHCLLCWAPGAGAAGLGSAASRQPHRAQGRPGPATQHPARRCVCTREIAGKAAGSSRPHAVQCALQQHGVAGTWLLCEGARLAATCRPWRVARAGISQCLRRLGPGAGAQAQLWEASAPGASAAGGILQRPPSAAAAGAQPARPPSAGTSASAAPGGAAFATVAACGHVLAGLALVEQRAAAIVAVQVGGRGARALASSAFLQQQRAVRESARHGVQLRPGVAAHAAERTRLGGTGAAGRGLSVWLGAAGNTGGPFR